MGGAFGMHREDKKCIRGLAGKPSGLKIPERRYENSIEIALREMVWQCVWTEFM